LLPASCPSGPPDLANHVGGQAAEPLRGNVPGAAVGWAASLMFDVMLGVRKSGQPAAVWGVSSLVGKLPDRVGDHTEQARVLLAE
jgi:hypothetical protein